MNNAWGSADGSRIESGENNTIILILEPREDITIILDPAAESTLSENIYSFLSKRLAYLTDTDGSNFESLASQVAALQVQIESGEMSVAHREQVLKLLATIGDVVKNMEPRNPRDETFPSGPSKKRKRPQLSTHARSKLVLRMQNSRAPRTILSRATETAQTKSLPPASSLSMPVSIPSRALRTILPRDTETE